MRVSSDRLRRSAGALLAALCLVTGFPAAAAPADLEARTEDGFGRIVLTFSGTTSPAYEARIVNGVFVLSFAIPVEAPVGTVASAIPDYVTIVRQDADGTAFRFALARAVKVNTMVAGEKLFLDFLPPEWSGNPPGLPAEVVAELARRAEAALAAQQAAAERRHARDNAGEVTLRVGRRPDFTRFDFTWSVPYRADFRRAGADVTIGFNRFGTLDLAGIANNLPPLVEAISAEDGEEGLVVRLRLAPGADVRAFRDGGDYVLDVTGEALDVEALAQPGAPDPLAEAAELVTAPDDVARRTSDAGNEATAGRADEAEDSPPIPAPAAERREGRDAAEPRIAVAGEGRLETRPHEPEARVETDAAALPATSELLAEGPESGTRIIAAAGVPVGSEVVGGAVRIELQFQTPVAAALFRRNTTLWLVLDTDEPIDLAGIRSALGDRLVDLREMTEPGTRTLLLRLRGPDLVMAMAEGNRWVIGIGDALMRPAERLVIERTILPDGTRALRAAFPDPGRVHELIDPVSGDRILVVTGFGPARGQLAPQSFVELTTLPSAQGIAVLPMADAVAAAIEGDSVVIRRPEGLALSSGAAARAEGRPRADAGRPGFVDLARWERVEPEAFTDTVDRLQAEIAAAVEVERPARRLELATLYLSRECGAETLGLLRMAAAESPELASAAHFRLMAAAANVFAGRIGEAARDLADESFNGNPDAAVWRTIAAAGTRDWRTALGLAPVAEVAMADYPAFVQDEVLLAVARSALEAESFATAERVLGDLAAHQLDRGRAAWRDLAGGRLAEARGLGPEAEAAYRRAIDSGVGPASSEAQYRLASLGYRSGLMEAAEAVAALETLSIGWRGDATELEALRLLGEIEAAEGHYREAFEASRRALLAGPDSPISRALQDHARAVFERLYLDGGADALEPIDALALYYDFREMTPVGRRGDAMVRRLADRLLAVDLVDQAAELLQHQVDERLKGAARAQVAADLAVVYLVDGRPRQALQVLRRTDQAELPALLERQRRMVEARIMTETGEPRAALELLASMAGDDVVRMRIDALWADGDWQTVAQEIERMHGNRWSDPLPLGDGERTAILRAAIAYVLAGDEFGVERLRAKYVAKMADGPDAQAFETVTRPIDSRGVEFRAVVREVAALDTLDAFLADYRRRYLGNRTTDAAAAGGPPGEAATVEG